MNSANVAIVDAPGVAPNGNVTAVPTPAPVLAAIAQDSTTPRDCIWSVTQIVSKVQSGDLGDLDQARSTCPAVAAAEYP